MRAYLGRSLSSANRNKINGILAEIDFRQHLADLGYSDRISPGGWVARSKGPGTFGHSTCVFFPETVLAGASYDPARTPAPPSLGLHTIAASFHQTGVHAYYCAPDVAVPNDELSVSWRAVQLGIPVIASFAPFPKLIPGFVPRARRYNYLRYKTDTKAIPSGRVAEEFSKECARIVFETDLRAEVSDVDAIFWGRQFTYPIEIKEKTAAPSKDLGEYFGLDIGPFVKLSFYAAKRGNLHSLFVVREVTDVETRQLANWWAISFESLAQYASWVFSAGGVNMRGGASAVVRIPKAEFQTLDKQFIEAL